MGISWYVFENAGYGKINGRTVYATCYDPTVFGGSQAAMQFELWTRTKPDARPAEALIIQEIKRRGRMPL